MLRPARFIPPLRFRILRSIIGPRPVGFMLRRAHLPWIPRIWTGACARPRSSRIRLPDRRDVRLLWRHSQALADDLPKLESFMPSGRSAVRRYLTNRTITIDVCRAGSPHQTSSRRPACDNRIPALTQHLGRLDALRRRMEPSSIVVERSGKRHVRAYPCFRIQGMLCGSTELGSSALGDDGRTGAAAGLLRRPKSAYTNLGPEQARAPALICYIWLG